MAKYIHLFDTQEEFNATYQNNYSTPWVSAIRGVNSSLRFNDNNYVICKSDNYGNILIGTQFSPTNNPRILFEDDYIRDYYHGHIINIIYYPQDNVLQARTDIPTKGGMTELIVINLSTNGWFVDFYMP